MWAWSRRHKRWRVWQTCRGLRRLSWMIKNLNILTHLLSLSWLITRCNFFGEVGISIVFLYRLITIKIYSHDTWRGICGINQILLIGLSVLRRLDLTPTKPKILKPRYSYRRFLRFPGPAEIISSRQNRLIWFSIQKWILIKLLLPVGRKSLILDINTLLTVISKHNLKRHGMAIFLFSLLLNCPWVHLIEWLTEIKFLIILLHWSIYKLYLLIFIKN